MSKYKKLWLTSPSTAVEDVQTVDPPIKLFGRVILKSVTGGFTKGNSLGTDLMEAKTSETTSLRDSNYRAVTDTLTATNLRLKLEAKSATKPPRPSGASVNVPASSPAGPETSPAEDDGSSGEENDSSSGSTRDSRAPFGKGGSGNGSASPSNTPMKGRTPERHESGSGQGGGSVENGDIGENGEIVWSLGLNVNNSSEVWQNGSLPVQEVDGGEKRGQEKGGRGNDSPDGKTADSVEIKHVDSNKRMTGETSKPEKADAEGCLGADIVDVAPGKSLAGDKGMSELQQQEQQEQQVQQPGAGGGGLKKPEKIVPCPRCDSMETKFCYFNNYNQNQPRHFCKKCQRYWTEGGTLRNVPIGSGRRKNKHSTRGQELGDSGGSGSIDKMDNGTLSMGVGLGSGEYDMALGRPPMMSRMRGVGPDGTLLESFGVPDSGVAVGLRQQSSLAASGDVAVPYIYVDPRTTLGLATDLAGGDEGSNMRLLLRDEAGTGMHHGYLGGAGVVDRRGEIGAVPMLHQTASVRNPAYGVPSHPHMATWQRGSGPWDSGPQVPYPANSFYTHSDTRVYAGPGGGYGMGGWNERGESHQTSMSYGPPCSGGPGNPWAASQRPHGTAWSPGGGGWNSGGVATPINQYSGCNHPSSAGGWGGVPQEGGVWGGGNMIPMNMEGVQKRSAEAMGAGSREAGYGGSGVWAPKTLRMAEIGEEVGRGGEDFGRNSAWTRVSMGLSPSENGSRMGLLRTTPVKEVTQASNVNPAAMARSMMFQEN